MEECNGGMDGTNGDTVMTWMSDKPTKKGYYWYRFSEEDQAPRVLYVDPVHNYVCLFDHDADERLSKQSGEWAGPLEPPC